jgi:hypothetical protein
MRIPFQTRGLLAAAFAVSFMGAIHQLEAQTAPTIYYACYVPLTGTVYRIKDTNLKTACTTGHVEFSWSPSGLIGPVGPQGPTGNAGPTGPQGLQGPAGQNGAAGPAGAAGQNGAQGVPGQDGAPGRAGPVGPAGATGTQGPQGPAGANGIDGVNGLGLPGPVGATGPAGPAGPAGPGGPAGGPGAAGATGATGATGPAGPTGQTGATGPVGPQGPAAGAGWQMVFNNGSFNAGILIPPNSIQTLSISCPVGKVITGSGFRLAAHVVWLEDYPVDSRTWNFVFRGTDLSQSGGVALHAVCINAS